MLFESIIMITKCLKIFNRKQHVQLYELTSSEINVNENDVRKV